MGVSVVAFSLSEHCQGYLSSLVRTSIANGLEGKHGLCPEPDWRDFSAQDVQSLQKKQGSFVTLTLNGHLRGCIGSIVGYEPLYQNVWHMAHSAAFSDPRFPPVRASEWEQCHAEISVLSEAVRCQDPDRIVIGTHGLILRYGGRSGVFLPQVPVEQGWNLRQYLDQLCLKAGVPVGSWQKDEAELYWYEAFVFPVLEESMASSHG
ncbi:MAG: AmmeMemoRadiSam system protein A [Desulfovibrio sp.]|nr:AmmeMemoRadiSam system protein A [Desulfovibrio sp.]